MELIIPSRHASSADPVLIIGLQSACEQATKKVRILVKCDVDIIKRDFSPLVLLKLGVPHDKRNWLIGNNWSTHYEIKRQCRLQSLVIPPQTAALDAPVTVTGSEVREPTMSHILNSRSRL